MRTAITHLVMHSGVEAHNSYAQPCEHLACAHSHAGAVEMSRLPADGPSTPYQMQGATAVAAYTTGRQASSSPNAAASA